MFLAEHRPSLGSGVIRQDAPTQLAVKILRPVILQRFRRLNLDARVAVRREWLALNQIMERPIPTELVVGVYGIGDASIEVSGRGFKLPWIALEHVDGGSEGSTVFRRVINARESTRGMDPVRVVRLVDRILRGVQILHETDIIHQNLGPDNVFVTGPVDNETPKISDCGISSLPAVTGTVYGIEVPSWGGPEQTIGGKMPAHRNPVVGPWTDVHALATLIWFILGGEEWFLNRNRHNTTTAALRSLSTARYLHEGFRESKGLLTQLDEVLARGAAYCLPECAWERDEALPYRRIAEKELPLLFEGESRFPYIATLRENLMPPLLEIADRWHHRAHSECRVAAAFRATHRCETADGETPRKVSLSGHNPKEALSGPLAADRLAVHVDGRMLAQVGEELVHLVGGGHPSPVLLPPDFRQAAEATRWVVRGPRDGYALVGPDTIVLASDRGFVPLTLPDRASGKIQAVLGDGRVFAIVCDGQLWRWRGESWATVPHDVHSVTEVNTIVSGPDGIVIIAGGTQQPYRGILATVGLAGVQYREFPRLQAIRVAVSGLNCIWAATDDGAVVRLQGSAEAVEMTLDGAAPVAMELDPIGCPWLLTQDSLFRRLGSSGRWTTYYQRPAERAPFVALGFTPAGASLVDAGGGVVVLEPNDVDHWRA